MRKHEGIISPVQVKDIQPEAPREEDHEAGQDNQCADFFRHLALFSHSVNDPETVDAPAEAQIGSPPVRSPWPREKAPRYASRCTMSGPNAGRQTATYSAPSFPGVLYCARSPLPATIA